MPFYDFKCDTCQRSEERFMSIAERDRTHDKLKCECGAPMRQMVGVPALVGLDSGPTGFMRNRVESDGCVDTFTRQRVARNNGGSLGGGFFVPGLCRPMHAFDPYAICHGRDDVIRKARELGVAVRGPGINVEPREPEPVVDDGVPSPHALNAEIAKEVRENHGGKLPRKDLPALVERLRAKHSRAKAPATRKRDRIYPVGT